MSPVSENKALLPALAGRPVEELSRLLEGLPRFRAGQIFRWIRDGAVSFPEMTDLPLALRQDLEDRFALYGSAVSSRFPDPDGTVKLRIRLRDGHSIEAVLLVDAAGRKTACLSTQAGCPAACVFCKTGALPFRRNLSSPEMVEQFLLLAAEAGEPLSNVVIMGMGEPFYNFGELMAALELLSSPGGFALSPRRITVSTSGIVRGIRDMADRRTGCRLALSLTTAEEKLRTRLMPVTAANPLRELREALRYYQGKDGRRITLEMVLLGGINTREEDADALRDFVRGMDAAVNLIPWNPVEGMGLDGIPLRPPGKAELARFTDEIERRGIKCTRRRRRGSSVGGACGQLGNSGETP